MRTSGWLRTGLLLGFAVPWAAAACGSDDGSKKDKPRYQSGGEGGGDSPDSSGGSGVAPEGGEPSVTAGSGGVAGSAPGAAGEAGSPPVTEGGAAGMASAGGAGAGGETDPGPRECATGTADCDDNHDDCETNTATDATNCGRCERTCGATAACTDGLCGATPILDPSGNSNYCDAVFSPTTAYMVTCWGSFTEVRVTPLEPGANILGTQLYTDSLPVTSARGMLIDGNDVLFGVQGSPSYLYKFPLDANGPEDVSIGYTFGDNQRFDSIRLVGDTFYWSHNTHTAAGQVQPGFIEKRVKTEDSTTTLVSGLGLNYGLQVFTSQMVWLERRTTNDVLSVYRAPIAGTAIANVELVAVAAAGGYMIRHGAYAYWTHKAAGPNGKVRRLLADDTNAEPEDIATGLNLPEGLIADDDYVYFKQLDALYRAPIDGGEAEQLSPAVPANDSQATQIYYVDDTYVYFAAGANGGSSTVVRVAK